MVLIGPPNIGRHELRQVNLVVIMAATKRMINDHNNIMTITITTIEI